MIVHVQLLHNRANHYNQKVLHSVYKLFKHNNCPGSL